MRSRSMDTALGRFTVSAEGDAIVTLTWGGTHVDDDALLAEAESQIIAYAEGRLKTFDLPLAPEGGGLQQQVMAAMRAIPFGETRTYGEIAKAVGAPAQAIGQACGANPIPIIIPCHRVTGTGRLGGFSAPGGVESKVKLLRHEGAYSLLI